MRPMSTARAVLLLGLVVGGSGLRVASPWRRPAGLSLRSLRPKPRWAAPGAPVDEPLLPKEGGAPQGGMDAVGAPTYTTMLKFALPTLGIYLSGPLLSLIDTAFVGKFAKSSAELAALGPATAICDQLTATCLFLAVATTNILANKLAQGKGEEAVEGPVHGLYIATVLGVVICAALQASAPACVRAFVGDGASLELVARAVAYVKIRALGFPFVLTTLVAQAGCLGGKDAKSALRACLLACAINFCGDLLFVPFLGWSAEGAALATALSQAGGALFMTRALVRNVLRPITGKIDWTPPSLRKVRSFLGFAGPVLLVNLGKYMPYSIVTAAVAGVSTEALAAHQVMLGVYFLFCMFSEPLGQVGQAFLPDTKVRGKKATLGLVRRVLKSAAVVGTVVTTSAAMGPLAFPGIFTNDPLVVDEMRKLLPFLVLLILPHSTTMSLEGVLLSSRDMRYLVSTYVANTAFVVGAIQIVKALGLGAAGAWSVLIAWNVLRITEQGSRLFLRRRKLLALD